MSTQRNIVSISKKLDFADDVEKIKDGFINHLAGLRIAVISTADRHEHLRNQWLDSQQISYEKYKFEIDNASDIKQVINGAEIVLFSGNNAFSINRMFKMYEKCMDRSIAICIANKMTPHHRAMLLMTGFDDVVDITKVQGDEFIARCSAMRLRAELAHQSYAAKLESELQLNAIADERKLNRRHKDILLSLLSSKNNTVSYEYLRESLSLTHEPISLIQMKVLVCQARKALRSGIKIASLSSLRIPGSGYKLLVNDKVENLVVSDDHPVSGQS